MQYVFPEPGKPTRINMTCSLTSMYGGEPRYSGNSASPHENTSGGSFYAFETRYFLVETALLTKKNSSGV